MEKSYFVHESSYVDEGCSIGAGTRIGIFPIYEGLCNRRKCNIGQNVLISPVWSGKRSEDSKQCVVYTVSVCEDGVFLGPSCVFPMSQSPCFIERKK